MDKTYKIKQVAEHRWFLFFKAKNRLGETLIIELSKCFDNGKGSLTDLWYYYGFTNKRLSTYWCITTYVKDSCGASYGKYNVQHKGISKIDFEWILEATEENKRLLIAAVYGLFANAKGKSATQKRLERIKEYAEDNGYEVVYSLPEGWQKVDLAGAPIGSTFITNMPYSFAAIKDGLLQKKLLVL